MYSLYSYAATLINSFFIKTKKEWGLIANAKVEYKLLKGFNKG